MRENKEAIKLVKIANGQIKSVLTMIEENRYCIDVSTQIQATISLLKKAQSLILSNHLKTCVIESIEKNDVEHKIDEIDLLLKSIIK